MKMTAKFEAEGESFDACFEQLNSAFNAEFSASGGGQDGKDGATFIPSVSDDGVISWTNDRGLTNPDPVNIRGKDGRDGVDGKDGYTPKKGVDYFDGKDGVNGKDGYTPIKGKDYFDGKDGRNGTDGLNGKDGYTPIKGKDYFDGVDGKNGIDGKDGYTPVKYKDYFTDADKEEMINSVISALPKYNGEVTEV